MTLWKCEAAAIQLEDEALWDPWPPLHGLSSDVMFTKCFTGEENPQIRALQVRREV